MHILQIGVCCDLTRVWHVKAWVRQLFLVCQQEFANFSLSCEDHFSRTQKDLLGCMTKADWLTIALQNSPLGERIQKFNN